MCDYGLVFACKVPAEHMTVNSACACVNSQFPVTHLAGIVSDGKRWPLVFGWGVPVAILGREGDGVQTGGIQLYLQSLIKVDFTWPEGLTLLVNDTQHTLRLL